MMAQKTPRIAGGHEQVSPEKDSPPEKKIRALMLGTRVQAKHGPK